MSIILLKLLTSLNYNLNKVKVEKKKPSNKVEVASSSGKQPSKAHPLMSSASLGAMPQRFVTENTITTLDSTVLSFKNIFITDFLIGSRETQ